MMASGWELAFWGSGLGFRLGLRLRLMRNILHDLALSIIIVHGGHAGTRVPACTARISSLGT